MVFTFLRAVLFSALLVLFMAAAPVQAAPFAFTAQNEPMPDFLCAYANAQQKICSVSSEIGGSVTGNLEFRTEDAFFAFLERSHDIVTYVDAETIYYYGRSQMESATLPLYRVSVSQISTALREMEAYDRRYPLRPISNGKMLRITAPPAYIAIVTQTVGDLEASFTAAKGTRVFRLKHAWADDIELNFMNQTVNIPGVATLIRRITADGGDAPAPVSGGETGGAVERLKGTGLASRTGTQEAPQRASPATSRTAGPGSGSRNNVVSGARIVADPRLNAVIVWDDEELMPLYETLVTELDQPVSLVEIRAAIVDISVERMQELGIAWDVARPVAGSSGFGATGGANVGVDDTAVDFASNMGYGLNLTTLYRNGLDTFMARVRALEQDGDASVLSRPAVLTLDNIQASLEVTNTYYIEVAGQEEVDLFDVTYGTILRVTPHVIKDEDSGAVSIKLTVHVEDGGSQAAASGTGISYPIVSKTQVNTQALVGDGQALIVGGHYYETSTSGDNGIPVLKSIPLLGGLFKTQSDQYRKQERLFIIAPRLVDPAKLQQEAQQYDELFARTMTTQPVVRIERSTGGCARQRRVAVEPVPVPAPVSAPSAGPLSGPGSEDIQ
ncbi:MAG: type III secretion system outer membrane ring subunit SctC [Deltaproteobacteria bacterium]|jgi:type III secretion protein C|nr:type III secretion system outer membrane ring subunit SctC [Deltaproteobacteria bacterium]